MRNYLRKINDKFFCKHIRSRNLEKGLVQPTDDQRIERTVSKKQDWRIVF